MARYVGKDERIARLLTDQGEGWLSFREMNLPEAVEAFGRFGGNASRIGIARSYLEMAEASGALDRMLLGVEAAYLGAAGEQTAGRERGRRAFALLRMGNLAGAREEFGKDPPQGQAARWAVGRAALSLAQGDAAGGPALDAALASGDRDAAALAVLEAHMRNRPVPPPLGRGSAYESAVEALRSGNPVGALKVLEGLNPVGLREDAGPDLYLYALYREAYSGMALDALKGMETVEAKWLAGRALWGRGAFAEAAEAFSAAENGNVSEEAFWLFGVPINAPELVETAKVWRGAALIRAGRRAEGEAVWKALASGKPGALALGELAAFQQELGLAEPLADPGVGAREAVTASQMLRLKALGTENGEVYSALLAARHAAIARDAAAVAGGRGDKRASLDYLDGAHQKHRGYRPDFVNPPSFLVDLARAYVDAGEYAPAVEILFELSEKEPATRFAYESLKRLYASRIGGAAPPR